MMINPTDATKMSVVFTKNHRGREESRYTFINRIFQSIGATRTHYVGRVFEGIDIHKIMAKSDELCGVDGEIRLKLLGHVINSGIVEKFHKTCDDICLALNFGMVPFLTSTHLIPLLNIAISSGQS